MFYVVFLSTNRIPIGPFENFANAQKTQRAQDENDAAMGWVNRRTAIMEDMINRKHNDFPTQPRGYRDDK